MLLFPVVKRMLMPGEADGKENEVWTRHGLIVNAEGTLAYNQKRQSCLQRWYMACSECDRLQAECARLEQAYETALNTLDIRIDTSPASEYMRLRAAVAEARIDSEVAHLELQRHKRVHSKANSARG
jgi:hypothetical protein